MQLTEIYKQFSSINYEYHANSKENSNILSSLLDNIRSTSPKYYKDHVLSSDSGNRSGYTSCDEDFSSTGSAGKESDISMGTNTTATNLTATSSNTSNKIGLKFPFGSNSGGSSQYISNAGIVGPEKTTSTKQDGSSISNSPIGSFKTSNRKSEKVTESLFWNLSVIKSELDSLYAVQSDCRSAFQQVC